MINFADNGNITHKSDAGDYSYDAVKINAVTGITGNQGTIDNSIQSISYNSFNQTTDIEVGDTTYTILYNPVNQRIKTSYTPTRDATVTRYYSGGYEKTVTGVGTKELHYINSPFGLVAIIVKQGESVQTYFVETDHLGSIIGLINPDKSYADSASFDAWGRRRNPADWSYEDVPVQLITDRGFTGHEHLDAFGLINMNGRMYDPVVGRFLNDDPIIQQADLSQCYNGYSYCLNNPLSMTDISGYESYVINNSDGSNSKEILNFIIDLLNSNGDLKSLELSNSWTKELDYDKDFLDYMYFLISDKNSGPSDSWQQKSKEVVAQVLTLAFKIKFKMVDAYIVAADPDGIFGYYNYEHNKARVVMLSGENIGHSSQIDLDYEGYLFDLSIGIQFTRVFYTKFGTNLRLKDIEGFARSISLGIGVIEGGVTISEELEIGGRLVGLDSGISLSPFPYSVSYKKTNTKIVKKK